MMPLIPPKAGAFVFVLIIIVAALKFGLWFDEKHSIGMPTRNRRKKK